MNKLLIILVGIAAGTILGDKIPRLYKIQPSTGIVRAAEAEKQLTKDQMIGNSKHVEQIMVIWTLESSMGENFKDKTALHNYCNSIGKTNEFGFGGMKYKWCYDSFQEAVNVIDDWFTQRDLEAYCYYNQGVRTNKCTYAQTAMRLLEK